MSTPIDLDVIRDAIPVRIRRAVYVVFGVALVLSLATAEGYRALDLTRPPWLVVILAVLQYLGVFIAALAVVNAKPTAAAEPKRALDADGDGQPDVAD